MLYIKLETYTTIRNITAWQDNSPTVVYMIGRGRIMFLFYVI